MPVDTLSTEPPVSYRPVASFPEYRVGDDGSVWSCWARHPVIGGGSRCRPENPWRRLKPWVDSEGYCAVRLRHDGRYHNRRVAHLILEAFIGPRPPGMNAAHNNGIPGDNRAGNLRWDTQANNIQDKRAHGTWQFGERHPRAKLTEDGVRTIRSERRRGVSRKDLATRFHVAEVTIDFVCRRRLWKHVDE